MTAVVTAVATVLTYVETPLLFSSTSYSASISRFPTDDDDAAAVAAVVVVVVVAVAADVIVSSDGYGADRGGADRDDAAIGRFSSAGLRRRHGRDSIRRRRHDH